MAKTTNKALDNKATANKEAKVMTKKEKAPKAQVVKEVKSQDTNATKANTVISIEDVMKLYAEVGIKCANPEAKGAYRIMGNKKGSSLNIKPTKGYYIYSTDVDFDLVKDVKADDFTAEKGTNSTDKVRPNTVICKTVETLKALLAIYATNPANRVAETK